MIEGFAVARFPGQTLPDVIEAVAATGVLRGNPIILTAGVPNPKADVTTDNQIVGVALNDYGSSPGSQVGMASYVNVITPSDAANRVVYTNDLGNIQYWGRCYTTGVHNAVPTTSNIGNEYDLILDAGGVYYEVNLSATARKWCHIDKIDLQLNRVLFHFTAAALATI